MGRERTGTNTRRQGSLGAFLEIEPYSLNVGSFVIQPWITNTALDALERDMGPQNWANKVGSLD